MREFPGKRRNAFGLDNLITKLIKNRGGATILRVGVQKILRAKPAEKFWGLYPHICHSVGYNSYKERHTESLSGSDATISYWSCSCNFSQYFSTF